MHRMAFVILVVATVSTAKAGPRAGLIDPTFGNLQGLASHGFNLVGEGSDVATAFAEDAQGRFYLAGTAEDGVGAPCLGVMRFSADGVLDAGYASGGKACVAAPPLDAASALEVHDILIAEDGTLLLSGAFEAGGLHTPFVCRLGGVGLLDTTFNADTPGCHVYFEQAEEEPSGVSSNIVRSAEKTLAVITLTNPQIGATYPAIYRLDKDGALLPFGDKDMVFPFGITPDVGIALFDVALAPGNRLNLAGADLNLGAIVAEFDIALASLNSEFGDNGTVLMGDAGVAAATAVSVDKQGEITVAGITPKTQGMIPMAFRLTHVGELDPAFNDGQATRLDPCVFMANGCYMNPEAIDVDTSGNVVFAGTGTFNGNAVSMWAMRLRPDGTADAGFGSTVLGQAGLARVNLSSNSDAAYGMALQGERVVLGGHMAGGDSEMDNDFVLVRLADGSLFRDGLESTP